MRPDDPSGAGAPVSRRLVVLAPVAMAGCGFAPVYGPGGTAEGLQGAISVAPPRDDAGYYLVRRLEERLGRADGAPYVLEADLLIDEEGVGITRDRDVTRIRLDGRARYVLRDGSGAPRTDGEVFAFASYDSPVFRAERTSVAGNAVSVRAAAVDARERLMVMLADRIVSRLLATAPDWRA